MANGSGLASVQHVVVLMLENRSFDHMLGFLYPGNVSPSGQPFEGLTGTESSPGSNGQPVTVFRIEPTTPNAYYMPGADPGEGYMATNNELYGSTNGPSSSGQAATSQGFVADFAYTLSWESKEPGQWPIVPGTVEGDIMGCFTPETLPVLSALARATRSVTSGSPRYRPRPCPTGPSPARRPARGTWTTRRTRSHRRAPRTAPGRAPRTPPGLTGPRTGRPSPAPVRGPGMCSA